MGKLDFLSTSEDADTATAAPEPVQEPAAPSEPQGDQPRGADGKFVAKETAETPAPQPEPEPAPQPEPTPEPQQPAPAEPQPRTEAPQVPLAALLDTRDEVKALKAELAQLRQAQTPPVQPEPPPDPNEDPAGYQAYRDSVVEQALFTQRRDFSRRIATLQHGAETVQQAHEWAYAQCDADPLFNQKVAASEDPYEFVVAEFKKHQLLTELSDPEKLAAFQAWRQAQAATPQPPAAPSAPAQPPPQPRPPPQSIASAPSAGGPAAIPTGPGTAFSGLFHKG